MRATQMFIVAPVMAGLAAATATSADGCKPEKGTNSYTDAVPDVSVPKAPSPSSGGYNAGGMPVYRRTYGSDSSNNKGDSKDTGKQSGDKSSGSNYGGKSNGSNDFGGKQSGDKSSGSKKSGSDDKGSGHGGYGSGGSGDKSSDNKKFGSGDKGSDSKESGSKYSGSKETGFGGKESGSKESGSKYSGSKETGFGGFGGNESGSKESGSKYSGSKETGFGAFGTAPILTIEKGGYATEVPSIPEAPKAPQTTDTPKGPVSDEDDSDSDDEDEEGSCKKCSHSAGHTASTTDSFAVGTALSRTAEKGGYATDVGSIPGVPGHGGSVPDVPGSVPTGSYVDKAVPTSFATSVTSVLGSGKGYATGAAYSATGYWNKFATGTGAVPTAVPGSSYGFNLGDKGEENHNGLGDIVATIEEIISEKAETMGTVFYGEGSRMETDCGEKDCWNGGQCSFVDYDLPAGIDGTASIAGDIWNKGSNCGGCVAVKHEGQAYTLMVADQASSASNATHLELTPKTWNLFAATSDYHVISGLKWNWIPCPIEEEPLWVRVHSEATQHWFAITIENGRERTSKLEVSPDAGKTWKECSLNDYNLHVVDGSLDAESVYVRATSITGKVVTVPDVSVAKDAVAKADKNYL
ncbi:hypothetical protein Cpir12675_006124 [Ceratocystis pirilliformis]|uniref:Expansin-YoaJ n=1 Tax=Ceratocystis pirilliformis TaxID=259994 RepID=A0ABR3YKN2_9PEZI